MNRLFFILTGILAGAFISSACEQLILTGRNPSAVPVQAAQTEKGALKEKCLGCHGPFEKMTGVTDKYTAPSGEKISPHRFVPHDSKKNEDVPECTNCHTAHAFNPPPAHESIDLSKVNVNWCYETCHHEKNFTSCKQCHA